MAVDTVEAAPPAPLPGNPYGIPTAPTVPTAATTTETENPNLQNLTYTTHKNLRQMPTAHSLSKAQKCPDSLRFCAVACCA